VMCGSWRQISKASRGRFAPFSCSDSAFLGRIFYAFLDEKCLQTFEQKVAQEWVAFSDERDPGEAAGTSPRGCSAPRRTCG